MVIIKMLGGLCMEMFMELQHQEIDYDNVLIEK